MRAVGRRERVVNTTGLSDDTSNSGRAAAGWPHATNAEIPSRMYMVSGRLIWAYYRAGLNVNVLLASTLPNCMG